ncbi:hypothetical protein D3C87_241830 [compost metagenome]
MIKFLTALKMQAIKIYDFIQELNDIPMKNFSGDFYEEKKRQARVPRKTKTKVEDLRPPKTPTA